MRDAPTSGFTLVEVVLAAAIVALIGVLAWSLLSTTARSVAAQEARASNPAAAARALERVASDLAALFVPEGDRGCALLLEEDGARAVFCAMRATGRTADFAWSEPRRIEYRLQREGGADAALARIEEPLAGPVGRVTNRILARVSDFSIEFHDGTVWHRAWPPPDASVEMLPRRARISIRTKGMADSMSSERWIPAGHSFTSRMIRAARAPATD